MVQINGVYLAHPDGGLLDLGDQKDGRAPQQQPGQHCGIEIHDTGEGVKGLILRGKDKRTHQFV